MKTDDSESELYFHYTGKRNTKEFLPICSFIVRCENYKGEEKKITYDNDVQGVVALFLVLRFFLTQGASILWVSAERTAIIHKLIAL